jgi:hypothetical protein
VPSPKNVYDPSGNRVGWTDSQVYHPDSGREEYNGDVYIDGKYSGRVDPTSGYTPNTTSSGGSGDFGAGLVGCLFTLMFASALGILRLYKLSWSEIKAGRYIRAALYISAPFLGSIFILLYSKSIGLYDLGQGIVLLVWLFTIAGAVLYGIYQGFRWIYKKFGLTVIIIIFGAIALLSICQILSVFSGI